MSEAIEGGNVTSGEAVREALKRYFEEPHSELGFDMSHTAGFESRFLAINLYLLGYTEFEPSAESVEAARRR